MRASVVEISGYVPAIMSLYMTGKNVDEARLSDIITHVDLSTDKRGFITNPTAEFEAYLDKVIKYGIAHEHETILDFLKISIFMEGLHRGAQDDYDAHAKRLDIIRSSTRANKKTSKFPEVSAWYKDKVLPLWEIHGRLPDSIGEFIRTPWGYVRADLAENPDVLRGLVGLDVACDNVSTVSFRNLRHIYDLRREGTHASPELRQAMEMVREDLNGKSPKLGYYLGKVAVTDLENPNDIVYEEKPDTVKLAKSDFKNLLY